MLNLKGDYGWQHGRAAYGYRKCVGKITIQLGGDEDRPLAAAARHSPAFAAAAHRATASRRHTQ